jgi:hypothetical protein
MREPYASWIDDPDEPDYWTEDDFIEMEKRLVAEYGLTRDAGPWEQSMLDSGAWNEVKSPPPPVERNDESA